jgi:hypothetical protein
MSDYIRDYSKGKIYKIVVDTDKEYKPYVGSTIEELSRRMAGHRSKYKNWKKNGKRHMTSYDLFDKFGVDKCKIILLDEYPCENISQLLMKEREWFDKIECCNKVKPFISKEEIFEQKKEYYQSNKEEITKKQKIYNQENKEQIAKRVKIYNQKNKEQITEKKKENFECVCGSIICKYSKVKHEKSKKHISFISQK